MSRDIYLYSVFSSEMSSWTNFLSFLSDCHGDCADCDGGTNTDCTACASDQFFDSTAGTCSKCFLLKFRSIFLHIWAIIYNKLLAHFIVMSFPGLLNEKKYCTFLGITFKVCSHVMKLTRHRYSARYCLALYQW